MSALQKLVGKYLSWASSAYLSALIYVATKELSKLLFSPEENSFDLDIVGRVSFLRSNFADKTFMSCQRHKSLQ